MERDLTRYPLERLADQVGTPFYLYDAGVLREKLRALRIDAVSGNEV
jgi:diaminopimelate decarboxylase